MVSRSSSHYTGPVSPAPVSARAMPRSPSPHAARHSSHHGHRSSNDHEHREHSNGHRSDYEHSIGRESEEHGHHRSGSHEPSSHHHHHTTRHVHRHVHGGHRRNSVGAEDAPASTLMGAGAGAMPYGQPRYPPTLGGDPLRGGHYPAQAGYIPPMGLAGGANGSPMYPGLQGYGGPMMMGMNGGAAGYPGYGAGGYAMAGRPGYAPPYGAASMMDPYYPGGGVAAGGAYGRPMMGPMGPMEHMTGPRAEMMMDSMHSPMHGQAMPDMSVDYAERLNGEPLVPGTHQYELALRYGAQMDAGMYPRRF